MNAIPEEYKIRQGEGWETVEERLARLEKKATQLENLQQGRTSYHDKFDYNGYLIVRDLEYTTYRIYDKDGKLIPGLSDGQFKQITKAQGQIDNHIALHKAMNALNGHGVQKTTTNH